MIRSEIAHKNKAIYKVVQDEAGFVVGRDVVLEYSPKGTYFNRYAKKTRSVNITLCACSSRDGHFFGTFYKRSLSTAQFWLWFIELVNYYRGWNKVKNRKLQIWMDNVGFHKSKALCYRICTQMADVEV